MENFHLFKYNSSIFTWLFKIAQNIVKNEYRTKSRTKEMLHEVIDFQSQSISLDIARDVDIRLDISAALARLNELDQQIISLRFSSIALYWKYPKSSGCLKAQLRTDSIVP